MAAALLRFAHACQVALCCYGGYQSYLAITNLQKYEQTTKKLAKWSQQVDEQLRKTQTTQASGAAAVCSSITSLTHASSRRLSPQ
jgi:aspartate/tyrosine/aromatic aminotransferase